MAFDPTEAMRAATRDYILGNTTVSEQRSFIEEQIKDPFDSGDNDYFRKLKKMVEDKDELDEICVDIFGRIQDRYPGLRIDTSDYDQHLSGLCSAVYKFFVRNVDRLMYLFIKEFIFTNKNRRALVDEFSNVKIPSYPKDQYGTKEFYILIVKLNAIIDEIFDNGVKLKEFIKYVSKSSKCPVYVDHIKDAIEQGILSDSGVVDDMYKLYKRSDLFRGHINKLEMAITSDLIVPYMKETGTLDVRLPTIEEPEEENNDEEDDDE